IFLKVTGVRVEKLQDISEEDAIKEGVTILNNIFIKENFPDYFKAYSSWEPERHGNKPPLGPTPKQRFEKLWQSINGPKSWYQNPYVWVYSFEKVEKPENF